jgi:nucleoside-diphosphate-sugar epimerase
MNHEISVGDLAALIARLMGVSPRIRSEAERERPASSEVERLVCDNSLLLKSTDWRPTHTLESGLRETIDWFTRQAAVPRPTEYHT